MEQFFQVGPIPSSVMTGSYDLKLVLLSYCVAALASYLALEFSGKIQTTDTGNKGRWFWLGFGSTIMGFGIWSMHFIGMLSFKMDMPMRYEYSLTACSLMIAIFASLFVLSFIYYGRERQKPFLLGGFFLGLSIAAMHYVGMAAMGDTMNIRYQPDLFFLSIFIAIVASIVALWIADQSNRPGLKSPALIKIASAILMGAAICGMHYTGMAAAVFTHKIATAAVGAGLDQSGLAPMVAIVTFGIMGIAFSVFASNDSKLQQQIELARQTGMSEIAATVLHNIGNVLNSVNVSVNLFKTNLSESELDGLIDLKELVNKHQDQFSDFILHDERGKEIPGYINLLADYWISEKQKFSKEINALITHIQHIRDIIATQQSVSGLSRYQEIVSIERLLDEALAITHFDANKTQIQIVKEYESMQAVILDKIKLLQVLINLMQNAKHALVASEAPLKILTAKCFLTKDQMFVIQVIDNGVGISQENLKKIFSYGFTTKKNGHGFGLHSAILMIQEMQGSLKVFSPGLNQGATFAIELPYTIRARVSGKQHHSEKESV